MLLDAHTLAEIESYATNLAWQAGELLNDYFDHPLRVTYKGKNAGDDPVTEADREVEAYLVREIQKTYPTHNVVGEEETKTDSHDGPLTWVIDPLDGTTNFLNGLPLYACSIALLFEGTPVIGAVFLPWPNHHKGRVLHARAGGGAWENDQPLSVSDAVSPTAGRITVLSGLHGKKLKPTGPLARQMGEKRSVGSIAYELALVSTGRYQYAFFGSPRIWDIAAGIVLVQEAGGMLLTYDTKWSELERVTSRTGDQFPDPQSLRAWTQPTLAGNPNMVRHVSSNLTRRWPSTVRSLLKFS
ncbi:MAG: inositol monophosphatase [SAR202 cluster bacterium]|nr:inositol monophosphatase [SAR202 cluster bacterium]